MRKKWKRKEDCLLSELVAILAALGGQDNSTTELDI